MTTTELEDAAGERELFDAFASLAHLPDRTRCRPLAFAGAAAALQLADVARLSGDEVAAAEARRGLRLVRDEAAELLQDLGRA